MKVLTLNTHSWIEDDPEEKLEQLAKRISEEDYDVIALQEVNQLKKAAPAIVDDFYCPVTDYVILEDNFALRLSERLQVLGAEYYWTWEFSHTGYGIYQEGLALLSKNPILPSSHLVSKVDDVDDVRRRIILTGVTEVDGKMICACSGHYSWWSAGGSEEGFKVEWEHTEQFLADVDYPLLVMGDFNNPEGTQGYQLVVNSELGIQDTFVTSEEQTGSFTVAKSIDGWSENKGLLRIDYVFASPELKAAHYQVMFDGISGPVVSDHFGVAVQFEEE